MAGNGRGWSEMAILSSVRDALLHSVTLYNDSPTKFTQCYQMHPRRTIREGSKARSACAPRFFLKMLIFIVYWKTISDILPILNFCIQNTIRHFLEPYFDKQHVLSLKTKRLNELWKTIQKLNWDFVQWITAELLLLSHC